VTQKMVEHLPELYDFTTAITGALSEVRWR